MLGSRFSVALLATALLAACSSHSATIGHEVAGRSQGVAWSSGPAIWATSDAPGDARVRYRWFGLRGGDEVDRGAGEASLPMRESLRSASPPFDAVRLETTFLDRDGRETGRLESTSAR